VLIKGGHSAEEMVEDILVHEPGTRIFSSPRIAGSNTHGTGCTLATAIACGLAESLPLIESIERARVFVQNAIRTAPGLGQGLGPLNHMHAIRC
jgi:hydroxymethylpyrimidine/phosphomethylpyrimidine kinase